MLQVTCFDASATNNPKERNDVFLLKGSIFLSRPMQSILVRDNPRSLALRPAVIDEDTPSVLVFEQLAEDHYHADPRCIVKLVPPNEFSLSKYTYLNSRPVFGCLGLIHIANGMQIYTLILM